MIVAAIPGPLLAAQRGIPTPSIPPWVLYLDNHVTITIPPRDEGRPFAVKGRIVDSSNTVLFSQAGVDREFFVQSFPPLQPGTYRLAVTVTEKTGAAVTLDRFPPPTVPVR